MSNTEGKCRECNQLLWVTKEKLICPGCEGYVENTEDLIRILKEDISKVLHQISQVARRTSNYQIFGYLINQLEMTAKEFLFSNFDINSGFEIIENWVKYSILVSAYIKKKKVLKMPSLEVYEGLMEFEEHANRFKNLSITLLKLNSKSIYSFKKADKMLLAIPSAKPITRTPDEVLAKQKLNAKMHASLEEQIIDMNFQSFIDVNFFISSFYRLIGNYLVKSLSLPEYIISRKKENAIKFLDIYEVLYEKLKKLVFYSSPGLSESDFLQMFGKQKLEELSSFLNVGGFKFRDYIKWKPNIFLQDNFHEKKAILPLFYSNEILRRILEIKTNRMKIGEVSSLKGKSLEDEIFGYCETLNVSGFHEDKKLLRIPYPSTGSRMKELADIIFLGERTEIVYVISIKAHSLITLKSQLNELEKFHSEQNLIEKGLDIVGLGNRCIKWLFITPVSLVSQFKNILVFNLTQLITFLFKSEGFKEIKLQEEKETLRLDDIEKIGTFDLDDRRFCREIVKIRNISNEEIVIWLYKPEILWMILIIDLQDFNDTTKLEKDMWIDILFEFRTKYSTQIASYHDSRIISESEAINSFNSRGIHGPFP